jgi:5'-nucleotidase / UDP-sugar diphosphatase
MKHCLKMAGIVLAVTAILVSCAGAPATKREAGKTYTLTVLHTNDHHGTVLPNGGQAGLAERATFIAGVRAANKNVLLIDAGDINTGSALSNMFKGEIDINAYNMMKYDAVPSETTSSTTPSPSSKPRKNRPSSRSFPPTSNMPTAHTSGNPIS